MVRDPLQSTQKIGCIENGCVSVANAKTSYDLQAPPGGRGTPCPAQAGVLLPISNFPNQFLEGQCQEGRPGHTIQPGSPPR